MYRIKARKKASAKQLERCGIRIKKITRFRVKEDQTDGSPDRVDDLKMYSNRLSSDQHSACSSPASSNTSIT